MKKNKKVLGVITMLSLALSLIGPINVSAATTPSLGIADTFGVLSSTFTRNIGITAITGDLGYTTIGGSGSHTVTGTVNIADATYNQAGIDQGTALTALNSQPCTFTFASGAIDLATDTTHGPIGIYTPGVYCTATASAASIGTGGITLSGAGTYIFRVDGALTSVDNSNVTLANSASSCDVFWTATSATTLGANTTFAGTIIDASGITIGNATSLSGRALAFGGTVTTDTNTINTACSVAAATIPSSPTRTKNNTITVVKHVINDNGRKATFSDFPLFVNGNPVSSGQSIGYAQGLYKITETNLPNYKTTFSGDCNSKGEVDHGGLNPYNNVCVVTNDDVGAPVVAPPIPPLIDVVKVPNPLALPVGPGPVTYTYTLRNIGTVPVTNVTMIGDTCSPISLISGDNNFDSKLDVNETWIYRCSITLSETHTNTIVATGVANGLTATDIASATVVVGVPLVPPLIHLTKVPSTLTLLAGGGSVTYTKKITNPGSVALSNVSLQDDKCSAMTYISGDVNHDLKLDPSETWTYTCATNLTETTTNTAVASGTANGMTVRDFAIATVVVAASVPKLPDTGLFSAEGQTLWYIIAIAVIFIALAAVYSIRSRKRQIN